MSGQGKILREAWAWWDEPYKVTYPEYLSTQREKETDMADPPGLGPRPGR